MVVKKCYAGMFLDISHTKIYIYENENTPFLLLCQFPNDFNAYSPSPPYNEGRDLEFT